MRTGLHYNEEKNDLICVVSLIEKYGGYWVHFIKELPEKEKFKYLERDYYNVREFFTDQGFKNTGYKFVGDFH